MADSSPQPTPIQEGLRLMSQCPLCRKQHATEDARILSKKNGAHLVHITCPHCANAVLAVVVVTQLGLSSVGMVTDLGTEDVMRLKQNGPVTEDELLAFHGILKEKNLFKII